MLNNKILSMSIVCRSGPLNSGSRISVSVKERNLCTAAVSYFFNNATAQRNPTLGRRELIGCVALIPIGLKTLDNFFAVR